MSGLPGAVTRRPDGAALIIAAGLAGLGVLLIWEGLRIPDKGGYAGIGSGHLPQFIGWGLLVLAVAHMVTGLRGSGEAQGPVAWMPVLWIVAGLALQLVLLHPFGFSVAAGVLFACTAAGLGRRRLWISLPVGIVFALAVYGVFDRLLRLNLPAGLVETLIYGG